MLTKNDSVSFVATVDSAKARAFYEGTLGLILVADEHYALVFDLNGPNPHHAVTVDTYSARHRQPK